MLSLRLRLIRSLPLAHPAGFVYVARFPSAPFPPGTFASPNGVLVAHNRMQLATQSATRCGCGPCYDDAGNVIETYQRKGDLKQW